MDSWVQEMKRSNQVPAFGSWDCNDDDLPFTQCFETAAARPNSSAGLLRYSYSGDRDLYLSGDLHRNHIVTPAMIIVPRRHRGRGSYKNGKEEKKERDIDYDVIKAAAAALARSRPQAQPAATARRNKAPPKAVDEDLYKISPDLLYAATQKKRAFGLFWCCCLRPSCD